MGRIMQYLTFVGTGNYSTLKYHFEDNEKLKWESRYVQYPIFKKYQNEIEEVVVFFTEKSQDRHAEELINTLGYENITSVLIDMDINFKEFVNELAKHIKQDSKIIVDVTHSFRQIPLRMIMALNYIQLMKNIEVEHIYYGRVMNSGKTNAYGVIVDNIQDYRNQEVTQYLSQFNNTLIIQPQDWKDLVEPDEKILRFLNALARFNEMVELCEFDSSVESVQKIVESSRSVEKEPDKYQMILPLTQKIREKFEEVSDQVLLKNKKKKLIKVLLEHRRFQNAITFVDEFLREECVHQALVPTAKKLDVVALAKKYHIRADDFVYTISQHLFKKAGIRKDEGGKPKLDSILANSSNVPNVLQVLRNNQQVINDFLNKIRNRMNHGTKIQSSGSIQEVEKQIVKSINEMIKVVDQL